MSMTGDDARLSFDIEVDATDAAAKTEAAFEKALLGAINSPQVKAAIAGIATSITNAFTNAKGKKNNLFEDVTKDAHRARSQVDKEVLAMRKSIDKLSTSVDKLGTEMRDMGRAAATAASQAARATKAAQVSADQASRENIVRMQTEAHKLRDLRRQQLVADQIASKAASDLNRQRLADSNNATRVAVEESKARTAIELSEQRQRLEFWRLFRSQLVQIERAIGYAFRTGVRVASAALRTLRRVATTVATGVVSAFKGITNGISSGFRTAVRVASAALRGLITVASTTARGVGTAFSRVASLITAPFRAALRGVRGILSQQESAVRQSVTRQTGFFQRLSSVSGLGLLAGGAGIGSFLTSGFRRAGEEESLQLALETILGDADQASRKLQDLADYARTTSFDFVGLSQSVLGFTAVTDDIGRSENLTKFLADLVALTGGGTGQFDRAALAFQQILAAGRIEGDELRQLAESLPGIPITDILIEKFFGGDRDAFADARRAGKLGDIIDADAFFAAIFEGVNERFPEAEGAAVRLAGTLTGMAQNLGENLEIFGAQVIGLVEGPIKGFISGLNEALFTIGQFVSGEGLSESASALRDMAGAFIKGVGLAASIRTAAAALGLLARALGLVLSPLGLLITAFGVLGVIFQQAYRSSEPFRTAVSGLVESLKLLGTSISNLLTGGLNRLIGILTGKEGSFGGLGDAIANITDKVTAGIDKIREWVDLIGTALGITGGTTERRNGLENPFEALAAQDPNQLISSNWLPEVARRRLLEGEGGFHEFTPFVSAADAVTIWDEFAPEWWGGFEEAVAPDQTVIDRARKELLRRLNASFLGPVVRFFIGPFAGAIRRAVSVVVKAFTEVRDFFDGLFDAIFGDGDETGDNRRGRGPKTLGDRLRQFFLVDSDIAPVVRKFVEIYTAVKNFFEPAIAAVVGALQTAWSVVQPIIQPLIDGFGELVQMFKEFDFSKLDLGNVALGAGIGAGIGGIIGGPLGLLLGGAAGALTQTPVFSGLISSLGNVWSKIQPLLERVWSNLTGWLADRFSEENLQQYALGFLGLVRAIGRTIGSIVTDPLFLAGVAAVAAGAATVVGAFIVGFGEAMLENAAQLAGYMADGIEAAWNSIKSSALDFLPDPIVDALSAVFSNPAIAAGISFALIGVGGIIIDSLGGAIATASAKSATGKTGKFSFKTLAASLVSGLVGSIADAARNVFRGGRGLISALFGGSGLTGGTVLNRTEDGKLRGIGSSIGQSILAGVAIGLTGYVAGRQGGQGSILLSILTGGATGAALGFSVAGGPGAAIGAALGALTAGVGAFFGNASRQAQEARDSVREFTDALREAGSAGALEVARSRFEDLGAGVRDLFEELGFSIPDFMARTAEDSTTLGREIGAIFANLRLALIDTGEASETQLGILSTAMAEAIALGDDFSIDELGRQLVSAGVPIEDFYDALTAGSGALDITRSDLDAIVGIIGGIQRDYGKAATSIEQDSVLMAGGFESVSEAAAAVRDALAGGGTAQDIRNILDAEGANLSAAEKLDAVRQATDELRDAADEARDAVKDLIDEILAPDQDDINRGVRQAARGFQESFNRVTEEGGSALQDNIDDLLEGFSGEIQDAIGEAIDLGIITDEASFDAFIDNLRTQIQQSDLSEDVKELLLGQLDEIQNDPRVDAVVNALSKAVNAVRTGEKLSTRTSLQGGGDSGAGAGGRLDATTYAAGFNSNGIAISGAIRRTVSDAFNTAGLATAVAALAAGAKITTSLAGGINSNKAVVQSAGGSAGAAAVSGASAASIAMFAVGVNMMASMEAGIRARAAATAVAAAAAAYAVINATKRALGIASPSKVFVTIGQQIGQGFVAGIEDAQGDMTAALTTAIDNALTAATDTAQSRTALVASAIFDALIPSTIPGGGASSTASRNYLDQILGIHEGRTSRLSGISDLLGTRTAGNWQRASAEINAASLNFTDSIISLRQEWESAWHQAFDPLQEGETRAALSFRQQNLLSTGPTTFAAGTFAGSENLAAIDTAISSIRQWGQMAFEAGADTNYVTSTLRQYTEQLRLQAIAFGFNATEVDNLISAYGLSSEAISKLQRDILDLSTATLEGIQNRSTMIAQLETIRDFGSELLGSGESAENVVNMLKALRNELVNSATAFGYSATQLASLVDQVGLSDSAFAEFLRQMAEFEQQASQAVTNPGSSQDRLDRPTVEVQNLNINVPYGDPEAIALTTLNELAFHLG